ncbi:MAG: hypothetical protein HOP02_15190 [Methylococcaceae bacterium]|nr:hypothetical protein [Methylococcaceae bacterium]
MSNDAPSSDTTDNRIHYVIAVHGIGKQRRNETILPVIGQFAAVRHHNKQFQNMLTLGGLTSQCNESGWIELADIPKDCATPLDNVQWIPDIADPASGKNFRFVDFCWSAGMYKQHILVAETTKVWSQTLVNRLNLRNLANAHGKATAWIVYLMKNLRKGMLFTEFVMNLRIPKLSSEIYGDFLGDVELYGNFPHTRGQAVRLFHETMAALHQAHRNEFGDDIDPCYTLIAHSLGTIMTLDAITYAFANKSSRSSDVVSRSDHIVHFPGYNGSDLSDEMAGVGFFKNHDTDSLPRLNWVQYLDSYVTLGSPIDKYLTLWTENYTHFNNTDWMDRNRINNKKTKIRHFNYADEQDPVGHELDVLITTPVWNELFEKGEDVVFARYAVPGFAHTDYWQDTELFYRIVDLAIDKRHLAIPADKNPEGYYTEWFKLDVYLKALFISYILLPMLGWMVTTFSLTAVLQSHFLLDNLPWMSASVFLITLVLTHIVMKLIIMWRLLLVISRNENSIMQEKPERKTARKWFRRVIYSSPVLWALLMWVDVLLPNAIPALFQNGLFMALVISLDIALIYKKTYKDWNDCKPSSLHFAEYLMNVPKV